MQQQETEGSTCNISGDEFVRRYDAGEYDDDPDQHGIMDMILMLPLVKHPHRILS